MKEYIIDNKKTLLKDHFIELAQNSKQTKVATGYFYLNGYELVSKSFNNMETMQLVVGNEINLNLNSEEQKSYKKYVKDNMFKDLSNIEDESLRTKIKELYKILKSDKIKVRIYNKGYLHSKLYIFLGKQKTAIVGSSNFTKPGFQDNIELNIIEERNEKVEELTAWFDEIWENETEPFKEDMIQIIESSGILKKGIKWGKYLPPKELFKVLAYEILDGKVDLVKEKKILTLFQDIGVLNAENKISKYYGCLIADSVGLGKSFIGSEIIKDFFYGKKEFWNKESKNKLKEKVKGCLLIVPAHLKKQWKEDVLLKNFFTNCITTSIDGEYYFKLIDQSVGYLGNIKIISDAKFSRETEHSLQEMSDLFDLILIDEAHRFRNKDTNAWKNVQLLKKKVNYKETSGNNVTEGIRNRFILLSATPLNNRISDLINIFKIFLDRDLRDLTRQGKNIKLFERYESLKKDLKANPGNKDLKHKLKETIKKIKNEILDDLMILRTRKYIKESERYKNTKINGKTLVFKDPQVKKVQYDSNLTAYYTDYLNLYNGLAEFLEELEYPYVDLFLIDEKSKLNIRTLMKVLLLKRVESSIYSFDVSIKRMENKEKFLLHLLNKNSDLNRIRDKWQEKYGSKAEEYDKDEELGVLVNEESEKVIEKDKIDLKELKEKTKNDLKLIKEYQKKIDKLRTVDNKYNDPKLERLKNELKKVFEGKTEIPKIILFSQFKDTVNYVYNELNEWIGSSTDSKVRNLKIDRITGDLDFETKERRLKRFAPLANEYKPSEDEEIHFLVSTDALSEGVNIQDASVVINYDLPWNPMRIVQRVGRVNRIGSTNDITVYNFFPDRDLEELLKLLKKLGDKIEDVQNLLAKEMQILSDEESITVDTIGEKIKNERSETDITELEVNTRSSDFQTADVYGEDEETIQKLKIINKLKDLGVSEEEFKDLEKFLKRKPYYTITKGKMLKLYEIWDIKRKEKMKDFLMNFDGTQGELVPFDEIIKLTEVDKGLKVTDLTYDKIEELKNNFINCDTFFEENYYKDYSNLFKASRQGYLQSFVGVQRKILRYLRSLSRLNKEKGEKERIIKIRHIYESMKLRTDEIKDLKLLFETYGINIEKDDLKKIKSTKIIGILEEFFEKYLSTKPDTYFGGIRTDRDLQFEVIGWQA